MERGTTHSQLVKNIIATVTYYDVLDLPLTSFEIWRHMIAHDGQGREQRYTFPEVAAALSSEGVTRRIMCENGFYFLPGRRDLLSDRIEREKLSARKLRRMRRLARVMSFLPYVRMIGATGSLSFKHGKADSDWDMFIVFARGRIWIARTILTLFLHGIGKRRHGNKVADRACLNYFVTEDNLEIWVKDLYSAHEYRSLIPLYDANIYGRFEAANAWIREFKPQYAPTLVPHKLTLPPSRFQGFVQAVLEAFFDLFRIETWLGRLQKEKIRRNPKTSLEGSLIEASDRALIFLPKPRGPRVFSAFKKRLSF